MTTWVDKSDSSSRFLDGGESTASSRTEALKDLFACLRNEIIGNGTAIEFNLLLFEVNCDTGRLIAAATTADQHTSGVIDGCSLRVQEVQDSWYDLLESGPSDEQFSAGVTKAVRELGMEFEHLLVSELDVLKQSSSPNGFKYRVYGSDPGVAIYEKEYLMT
jgi:hypothetical protein